MDPQTKLSVVFLMMLLVLAMMIPATRALLTEILKTFIIPAASALLTLSSLWLMLTMKKIVEAHLGLIQNLLKPHSVVFPTLEKEDQNSPPNP